MVGPRPEKAGTKKTPLLLSTSIENCSLSLTDFISCKLSLIHETVPPAKEPKHSNA